MAIARIKRRSFNISMFNIKISPRTNDENFTQRYVDLIKKLHSENIAIKTRGEKYMELRTLNSYDNDKVLFGKLTYYTILDGNDWYNKRSKTIENVEIEDDLYPNAKEIEYYFIPEAHRFCFINKTNGIAMSQIEVFLSKALPMLVSEDKTVIVTQELTEDIIDRIISAAKIFRLEIDLSYSNNDLSDDFEELLDNDLRDGHVRNINLSAKSFKSQTIDLENSKFLSAALKLSQSNGYAEATIENTDGKNENVATIEYPRKELIHSTEGNEHIDVLTKILRLFRNG
ncbi:DUF4747 family protein [Paludibacter jiangxiensis]|uniref:DUF4747 family protein n=1 Tax=Paludibacter jiangxiensis TaxID=681398 RepID=A0A170ZLA4_9BACT|nr:DUF4747 family protein [Paludibacter jiangxiensis]GAT62786.1 hypothetical protein PJIAN_389 [Paludibacter jiangxiensis]